MFLKHASDFKRYNILAWETDALYHKISLAFDMSDSAVYILYILCYSGNSAPLRDVVRFSGLQKQTVNSSLRSMEKKGLLTLENSDGRSKTVSLTEKGKEEAERTVKHLIEWENDAISSFSEDEIKFFLSLMEKYLVSMKESFSSYESKIPPKIE